MICLTLALGLALWAQGCGRKGDPIPRPRAEPMACQAQWVDLRTLDVKLPSQDVRKDDLVGLDRIRVYYLALESVRPSPRDVLAKGEVILEKRRPDLPAPGKSLRLDLKDISRGTGWIVVAAVRVGNVVGTPSEVLPWMNPAI